MAATQILESLLNSVKASNLNFHIKQSPFGAIISIKNTLIKDKFGNHLKPTQLDSEIVKQLETENHALCDKIVNLENYGTSLRNNLEDAFDENDKAHKTI